MAFSASLDGFLRSSIGYDINGETLLLEPTVIRFSPVVVRVEGTTAGNSKELTSDLANILIDKKENVKIGDVFIFDGFEYFVKSIIVRRTAYGIVDHFQCGLEIKP